MNKQYNIKDLNKIVKMILEILNIEVVEKDDEPEEFKSKYI